MRSRWSDDEASRFVERYAPRFGEDLALRTYTARLPGAEPSLVLHGGGHTPGQGRHGNLLGGRVEGRLGEASGLGASTISRLVNGKRPANERLLVNGKRPANERHALRMLVPLLADPDVYDDVNDLVSLADGDIFTEPRRKKSD